MKQIMLYDQNNIFIKFCKKHGNLSNKKIVKSRKGILCCKICRNEYAEKWRKNNKEKQKKKCLLLRELNVRGLVSKKCNIHGDLKSEDILINNRACRICALCVRKKVLATYAEKKKNTPISDYQKLRAEKTNGYCRKCNKYSRSTKGKKPCNI